MHLAQWMYPQSAAPCLRSSCLHKPKSAFTKRQLVITSPLASLHGMLQAAAGAGAVRLYECILMCTAVRVFMVGPANALLDACGHVVNFSGQHHGQHSISQHVSALYEEVHRKLCQPPLAQHFERAWVAHISCKGAMYKLMALQNSATALSSGDDLQGCGKGLARLGVRAVGYRS